MKVAFGIKAHSGWAALVVVGARSGEIQVVDRRRMELVAECDGSWAKAPYHAAERLNPGAARALVERGIEAARQVALREMRTAVERAAAAGHAVSACALLTANPMPEWTTGEILAVHFRMHKAEGALFRDALARATSECGLKFVAVLERELEQHAERTLTTSLSALRTTIASLGKSVGPPWGKDQKDASLAALIALQGRVK